jgi:hypothetical protein
MVSCDAIGVDCAAAVATPAARLAANNSRAQSRLFNKKRCARKHDWTAEITGVEDMRNLVFCY